MIQTEMMTAQLVGVEAMRDGCRQLWQDFLPDGDPDAGTAGAGAEAKP